MNQKLVDTSAIRGWGVDANPDNDPTYPIRHLQDQQTRGLTWTRPAQQSPDVEILRSIEHNRLPAVMGTSTPPSGLSGIIRRYAFRRSESDRWHWLLLMGANRPNVVEGVIEDLGKGKVPNIPAEMGARAEWQHNKKGAVAKVAVVSALVLATTMFLRSKRSPNDDGRDDHPVVALNPPEAYSDAGVVDGQSSG